MNVDTIAAVTEDIYAALANDNEDIDHHIARLKQALAAAGAGEARFDPARLPQNNRSGRKTMQAYFRQRGVKVVFES
ncbi:hypothetical protein [Salinarimonas chemoclinalis]|uniref:hypothetical protein n=1 Tax=Salinarimonas chemoclinalis TaxID=3241599 RepID=UPI003557C47F